MRYDSRTCDDSNLKSTPFGSNYDRTNVS